MDDDGVEGAVPLHELEAHLRDADVPRAVRRRMLRDARRFSRFSIDGGAELVRFRACRCSDCGKPMLHMFGCDDRADRRLH